MADIKKIHVNNTTYNLKDDRIPALTNNTSTFLRADGAWADPSANLPDPVEVVDNSTYMTITTGESGGGSGGSSAVLGAKTVTANGTYNASSDGYDGYSSVTVNVNTSSTPKLQAKTGISPSTSSQTIRPDSGYDGLSSVQINAMSSMTLPTAAATSAASGSTSKATISRSTSAQYINIPTGYNSTKAHYTISATPNGKVTAPSSISGTSASVTTGTNTLTLTKSISVTPNVSTAGYISAGTAGNSNVSLTASVTTKAAATITPGTSNQTIAAGTYLTGAQTIAGDADLTAANIKKGVNIFNVTGTYTSDATAAAADVVSGKTAYVNGSKVTGSLVVQKYYTGSSVPASTLGNNGDIYLQIR